MLRCLQNSRSTCITNKNGERNNCFERILEQYKQLVKIPHCALRATGNLNANTLLILKLIGINFLKFIKNIGLKRSYPTTQIEHYDNLSSQLDALKINIILIDLCRISGPISL